MKRISQFSMHNNRGHVRLESARDQWRDPDSGSEIFGPVVKYSWLVGAENYFLEKADISLRELPDASGFIAFESDWKPDNCLLLDVYGKERMRLTVPCEMTGSTHPESARAPTSFANISEPYEHPQTGEKGKFGATAWVERMGKFYFELDYHAGKFLWCRQIRD